MKKILSLLLVLLMVFAAVPVMAESTVPSITTTAYAEKIQKYGNVTLEVSCEDFLKAGYVFGDVVTVSFLGQEMDLPFCSNYSDVDSGTAGVFARNGAVNLLVAINMGDFATTYGIATKETFEDKTFKWTNKEGVADPVEFTIAMKTPAGYYDQFVMHQLSASNKREDYPDLSDEQFANFREVTTTGMGKERLYRTATPVDPQNNRNTYADAALKKAGVTVVMNLANDEASVKAFEGYDQSYYSTTKYIALNMGVDVASEEFKAKLAEGLAFLAANKGIYAVHCTEGKDRAGFVAALLESLMGASFEEIKADYMTTYYNYYGVTKEDARYEVIASSNIEKTLKNAFGVSDLSTANLADCAAAYLKNIGLSEEEIAALKANLAEDKPEEPVVEIAPVIEIAPAVEETVVEVVKAEEPKTEEATYLVVKGDTLWNLAKKFYKNGWKYKQLAKANKILNPDKIYAGQILVIPVE